MRPTNHIYLTIHNNSLHTHTHTHTNTHTETEREEREMGTVAVDSAGIFPEDHTTANSKDLDAGALFVLKSRGDPSVIYH